jgi:hypothetical protein
VTPAGATHENEPDVVKACCPWVIAVILLEAALEGPVPPGVVPATVKV